MTKAAEGIRLVSVEGENIRKLSTVAVRFDGKPGVFRVTGDNEEGKSTFLDIIAMMFGGKKAVKSSTIQKGKDGAWFKGTLNNGYSIGLKFTASAPDGYLTITTPDDAIQKAPQTLLDGWGGPRSFDPGALLKKKISEIEAIILGLAKDPDLKEKRTKIAAKRVELQDERRPLNSQKQKAERTRRPEGERPDPVDVSGELEGMKILRETQRKRERAISSIQTMETESRRREDRIAELREEIEKEEEFWKNLQSSIKGDSETLEGLPDRSEEIHRIEARLSEADDINQALEPWKEYDRAQAEAKEAGKSAAKLTTKIKALDAEEEALLKAAEIPVRGISFSEDGGMLLDGHPLDVASGMRSLDMAYDIGVAAGGQVKICLMDEANDYGVKALERLNKRAENDGVQVVGARLGLEGPGEIVVVDGQAFSEGQGADK